MTRLPSLGPRGEGWVAAQLGLLAAILLAGPWVGGAWYGDVGFATGIAGVVLIVVAAVLGARGIIDLGGALTPLPHPRDDADLVEDGVYARVRHPIYGGLIVASFGWGLLWASLTALALAAVLALFFVLKSSREEAWLLERFPAYAAYRRRTRRFLPFPVTRPRRGGPANGG